MEVKNINTNICISINNSGTNSLETTAPKSVDPKSKSYMYIPKMTQNWENKLIYDFCFGLRFNQIDSSLKLHISVTTDETYVCIFDEDITPEKDYILPIKYYCPMTMRVYDAEKPEHPLLFEHKFDLTDKEVLIILPDGGLGDSVSWFSYTERFMQKNKCKLTVASAAWFIPLVSKQYPDIKLITHKELEQQKPYAIYRVGVSFNHDRYYQPIDYRHVGQNRAVAIMLGVDGPQEPIRFDLSAPRQIKEKYVCIASQGSARAKCWNNPYGWREVIKFLKDNGYRVLCIDRDTASGEPPYWMQAPIGAEDFTGALPLQERINLLKDADFFIGMPSGLSWFAWCCKIPVVLISGFSLPWAEFPTPYRVINYQVCNGCWDDEREAFNHSDYMWCPRHKGDKRQFECTRAISGQQVINMIKTVPEFKAATTNTNT